MDRYTIVDLALCFFSPLMEAAASAGAETDLLRALGFARPSGCALLGGLQPALKGVLDAATRLYNLPDDCTDTQVAEELVLLAAAVTSTTAAALNLAQDIDDSVRESPLVVGTNILDVLPGRLLDYLICMFVYRQAPAAFGVLRFFGIIESPFVRSDGDPLLADFTHVTVNWDRFRDVFSDPVDLLKKRYGWDCTEGMEIETFIRDLRFLSSCFGLWSGLQGIDPRARAAFELALSGGAKIPPSDNCIALRLPLIPMQESAVGCEIYPVWDAADRPDGIGVALYADANLSVDQVRVSDSVTASISLASHADGFGFVLRRGQDPKFTSGIFAGSPAEVLAATSIDARIAFLYAPSLGNSITLIGTDSGTHFAIGSLKTSIALKKPDAGDLEVSLEMALSGGTLVVRASEGDGFLGRVLGNGFTTSFDVSLGFSTVRGFFISGGAGLEIILPINQSIFDVVMIESLYLAAQAKSDSIQAIIAASANAKLGPFSASIDKIGISVKVRFPAGESFVPSIGFKPPNGAGLSVDTSMITGGGFLFIDEEKGQYVGGLQLEIKDEIAIAAIGLINTKLPDGRKTFSLLVIISAEFPAIQLGYGFSLNGVGGLLGVNRTMVVDVLRAGIKNRVLNSIMFPKDIATNAAKIVSDLSSIFPPAEGRFAFGIMAKICWSDSLIVGDLGIILELPSPVRLAILGRLQIVLPSEDNAILCLHLDSIGILDFDRSMASIDASLYDSRVVKFDLAGDMAMRLGWGAKPVFAFSVGGFHPKFSPPPDFPKLERMSISLSSGEDMGIRLESYFALTSNSLQFGGRIEGHFKRDIDIIGTLSAEAYLALDCLVKWPPFWFEVDISGGVDVKRNGAPLISAEVFIALSGPGPWMAHITARVEFLGTHELEYDWKSDDEENRELPAPPDTLAELKMALLDSSSWSAQQGGTSAGVTLRQMEANGDLLVHPFGSLTLRQRAVPLNVKLYRAGSIPLPQPVSYTVEQIKVGAYYNDAPEEVRDAFAAGQFFELSDDDKLNRPAFEDLPSGYTNLSGGSGPLHGNSVDISWDYEVTTIDAQEVQRTKKNEPGHTMASGMVDRAARRGAAGQAAIRRKGGDRYANPNSKIQVQVNSPAYHVTRLDNLSVQKNQEAIKSYVEAEALRTQDGYDSSTQIVGRHEVMYV